MRELSPTIYNTDYHTSESTLYKQMLTEPVLLSKNITYLYGKDSNMFPLLMNTEGQGLVKSMKPKLLNDTQYEWPVMGRMKHTDVCCGLVNPAMTAPGIGFTPFQVIFSTNRFIGQFGVLSPDKQHLCRIQGEPTQLGANKWKYTFVITGSNNNEYVSLDNFAEGKVWVMTAPSVAGELSDGNRSNRMAPGRMTNQFGFARFSQNIAGNIANKVAIYEFDTEGGGKTNLWMPYEMKNFELDRRLFLETELWISKYNRDVNGVITTIDEKTGKPVPKGAGIFEMLELSGNHDTYAAPTLTIAKLVNTVNAVFGNRVDKTPMEIVLYTGAGGLRVFNEALMRDANSKSYYQKLGESVIGGDGTYMTYGNYFTQFRTIDGFLITVRECNFFNHGLIAEMDRANGNMIEGFPAFSYNLVFLDHSMNDNGDRNIQLVAEEGRELITGVYKGMTPLPAVWNAAVSGNLLSDKRDMASYEVLMSQGITMLNNTTSFWLEPEQ